MNILVQKYGGSSLATLERLRTVAGRVAAVHRTGRSVVVVVSARGRSTDTLLKVTTTLNACAPAREADQLLSTAEISSAAQLTMVLDAIGIPAVSLTGWQAGIRVSGPHGEGRIAEIDAARLQTLLRSGFVPVVSGFQGINPDNDVITLGRGGSDTTAVALAAALGAERCEIYTDVDGVFTADPRVVPRARQLPHVDFRVMAEMARTGAKVLHPRSVELAFSHDVAVHVRNSWTDGPGSVLIKKGRHSMERPDEVTAVTHDAGAAEVSISFRQMHRVSLPEILERLAEIGVDVDLLTQVSHGQHYLVRFTVPDHHVSDVQAVLAGIVPESGDALRINQALGKVSVIGAGPAASAAHSARMLRALGAAGIVTAAISTAQMRTSALVPRPELAEAVAVLHEAFGLAVSQESRQAPITPTTR